MTVSADGAIIYGGQPGSLTTSEGTWTFGAQAPDGVDWNTQLNGSQNGWGFQMQITNGQLYTVNKTTGFWYVRQNGVWVRVGTTAPVESAPWPPPSVSPDGSIISDGKSLTCKLKLQRVILAIDLGQFRQESQVSVQTIHQIFFVERCRA